MCVTTAGVVSTVAGGGGSTVAGYVNGVGAVAKFRNPIGISVDSTGNVWVADQINHMIRKINTAGRVHTCMHTHTYIVHVACVCSCVSVYVCIYAVFSVCAVLANR